MRTEMLHRIFWGIALVLLAMLLTPCLASAVWPHGPNVNVPVSIASAADKNITLSWATASEVNNLGFHVLRAQEKNGPYVLITPNLVTGAGNSTFKHAYSFTDMTALPGRQYWYKLESVAFNGTRKTYEPISAILSGDAHQSAVPSRFALSQNSPNPFNPLTTIPYSIAQPGMVHLAVYDILGRKVATLVQGQMTPGYYAATWNADGFASGIYYCRLEQDGKVETNKMLLMK